MKHYLDLISISAKVRRRQNRMTILCIVISVLLVTTVFSIADMMLQTQTGRMADKHGNWHYSIEYASKDVIKAIGADADVSAVGQAQSFNLAFEQPYYIGGKNTAILGVDESYMIQIKNGVTEGEFPSNNNEILLTENAKIIMSAQIGDSVQLHTPAGAFDFIVSGFGNDDASYYTGQYYGIGAAMLPEVFTAVLAQNKEPEPAVTYYIQFENSAKASVKIAEWKKECLLHDADIAENMAMMGVAGQSDNEAMKNLYSIAAIIFILVLLAGVLMISGGMNSNMAQRTQFFGMLRCIGTSRKQIIRLVCFEALSWCKTAVPLGIILGTLISWGICAVLHYGIGGEFSTTPVFKFSAVGIGCGTLVGVVTVLLAAQLPAKQAANISPMAAVSGNSDNTVYSKYGVKHNLGKIEWTLGIHHAISSKKTGQ